MVNVFLHLLNMSFTAGILVVAVVLLRAAFFKAPRWIHCLLWALVAVRLLCPFAIESDFSLMPSAATVPMSVAESTPEPPATQSVVPDAPVQSTPVVDTTVEDTPVVDTPIEGTPIVDTPVGDTPLVDTPIVNAPTETPSTDVVVSTPDTQSAANPWQTVLSVASWVWLAGMVAMATYAVFTTLRLRRQVGEAAHLRDNLWQCDHLRSPFILGVFRPRIYLPSDLSGTARDSVVAHEQAHLRRHDHWWKPLGFLLLTVYWFNPLMWMAYILLCRDIEAACDERVVRDMNAASRRSYSEALLRCSAPRRLVSACPLAFGETSVKSRIKSVLSYKKPTVWIIVVALLVSTVAGVCLLTNPKSDKTDKGDDDKTAVSTQPTEPDEDTEPGEGEDEPVGITKENTWQTLGHPMTYQEAAKVSDGCPLTEDNRARLQTILDEVTWHSNTASVDPMYFDAYFSLDGVVRYYVSLDIGGLSGCLYNGKEYANLTEEQAGFLDYMLPDGGSTIEATHVLYGYFAEWNKDQRHFVLDVVQADDAALVGKKIRVNTQNTYGKGLPYIGSLLKADYDGTVLNDTIYAKSLAAPEEDAPKVDTSSMAQSGTITGKVIYATNKAVLLNCYDKAGFDVVWVRFENANPQMGEEYRVAYDGLSVETYPYQVTAKTMEYVSSTPLNNGFISEEKAIAFAVDHWNVSLDTPDMVYGYYTTVYVIEQPTADNPYYKIGSRRVDVQDGKPKNSALFETLYMDAVTGKVVFDTLEQE